MRPLALLLVVVACSNRPLPLPQPPTDLGRPTDLARFDLAHGDLAAACGGGCLSVGCACVSSVDCCTGYCDPQAHLCFAIMEEDLAAPRCPRGDCVSAKCGPCTASADCCAGLVCVIAGGALVGDCEPPPPPDLAPACANGGDCIQSGGACMIDCDCCPGTRCMFRSGTIEGFCAPP